MTYLFFGYLVVWLGIAFYVGWLSLRTEQLRREVADLRRDRSMDGDDRRGE
jgi:CcmD family protein